MLKILLTIMLTTLPTPAGVPRAQHAAWVRRVAPVILHATHGDPALTAYVVATGEYESHFAERIQAGHCRKKHHECDGGLAHGMWQEHILALRTQHYTPADVVGTDDAHLRAAADAAARRMRGMIAMCGTAHPVRVFGGYAKSCDYVPHKAAERVRLYRYILRRLRAAP